MLRQSVVTLVLLLDERQELVINVAMPVLKRLPQKAVSSLEEVLLSCSIGAGSSPCFLFTLEVFKKRQFRSGLLFFILKLMLVDQKWVCTYRLG